MLRQIKVTELCKELEEKLVGLQYSEDSLRRYRKVFREFEEYAGDCDYSQSRGTDFLLWKFKQLGGFVTSGEHSKNEMYYFRVIRSLAEYYNFGTLFRRHDYDGEIVWPLPFKEVTEGFLQYEVEYGCSQCESVRNLVSLEAHASLDKTSICRNLLLILGIFCCRIFLLLLV